MQDINKLNSKRLIKKFEQCRKSSAAKDIISTIKIVRILINRGYYSFVLASLKYDN